MTAADTLGIDFGTTNTVVALAATQGPARLIRFAAPDRELFAFRSALAFQAPPERPGERLATERYDAAFRRLGFEELLYVHEPVGAAFFFARDLARDAALADARLTSGDVDRVFLTGGSSLVPAVRDIFHRRFPSDRIETGAELESIASGLALIGREPDADRWAVRA